MFISNNRASFGGGLQANSYNLRWTSFNRIHFTALLELKHTPGIFVVAVAVIVFVALSTSALWVEDAFMFTFARIVILSFNLIHLYVVNKFVL